MAPRTTREALVAEMLGEIDGLLVRCEAFGAKVDALQAQMAASSATLDAAGERYRATIRAFTEQAKEQLTAYLERRASDAGAQLLAGQRAELQEALARTLAAIEEGRAGPPRPAWMRIAEIGAAALLSSVCTAGLVVWLLR